MSNLENEFFPQCTQRPNTHDVHVHTPLKAKHLRSRGVRHAISQNNWDLLKQNLRLKFLFSFTLWTKDTSRRLVPLKMYHWFSLEDGVFSLSMHRLVRRKQCVDVDRLPTGKTDCLHDIHVPRCSLQRHRRLESTLGKKHGSQITSIAVSSSLG